MPINNVNPFLLRIKNNLDKWEKINLTLWGKNNIIKITVAPQFNYIAVMLPITIPNVIFKKYDNTLTLLVGY